MNDIIDGFVQAIQLIVTLDPKVMEIAMRTHMISLTATLLASLLAIPIGWWIHFHEFTGKRAAINIIQTMYAVPTVIVGLFVYLLLSSSGRSVCSGTSKHRQVRYLPRCSSSSRPMTLTRARILRTGLPW